MSFLVKDAKKQEKENKKKTKVALHLALIIESDVQEE